MKYDRISSLFCVFFLTFSLLFSGCNSTAVPTEPIANSIPIVVKENIPEAVIGQSYKLSSLIVRDKNIAYTYTASYTDPTSGEVHELPVKNDRITPIAEADITVTVTATRDSSSSTTTFVVPVFVTTDILDKLLASGGIADQADDSVSKSITKESAYLIDEKSSSALKVRFSNPTDYGSGTSLLNLSHHSLQAYYTAQVWRNAAVSFWVYNPMDQAISFKLTHHNSSELLWNSPENIQVQIAEPNRWTNILFSLYDMGIESPIVDSDSSIKTSSLQLSARYDGDEECTLYIDSLDIIPADSVEGLSTGYTAPSVPAGDYSDLLKKCKVYTKNPDVTLSSSTKGNGSPDAYFFGSKKAIGYPTLYLDLPQTTDISGFDYLKLDVYAENVHPWISVAVHYLDENGQIQKHGTAYDFYQNQWRTVYVNLDYLDQADLTKVVGFSITVNLDSNFQPSVTNGLYFDNISLYTYPKNEPQMAAATMEDNDIISGPFTTIKTKPNISGVCKVATDETGLQKSNSTLLFWANNAYGYPSATFMFDEAQDWSQYTMLNFDTHQSNAHFWMRFEILYLDEDGNQQTFTWYNDAMFNHWQTTSAPLSWFTNNGVSAKPEYLKQVVGFRITVDLFVHVTNEVGMIFFDNFNLS